ncbi:MAG: MnhB domain-containing protein [Methanobacteriaceae archaeon]|nr:MnhB domain-containing protein [Methanobacteriaceae archaeon]
MSDILKIIAFPLSLIMMAYGAITILGGHITPGGGFQGGAMMASGAILCVITYGLKNNPYNLSHNRMSIIESLGALAYVGLGLCGLFIGGSFLYNLGANIYGLVPAGIATIFNYPDALHAGIIPYLNFVVGLKVFIGLTSIVLVFKGITNFKEDYVDTEELD